MKIKSLVQPEKELQHAKDNIRLVKRWTLGGTFLDLGANVGYVSECALQRFKKVVSVEAHPDTFLRLKDRFKYEKRIVLIEGAVDENDGKEMFISSPKCSTCCSVRSKMRLSNPDYYRKVKTISFASLLKKYRPTVIKADIEGSEHTVFRSAKINSECKMLIIEFHETRNNKGWERYLETSRWLSKQGFKRTVPLIFSMLPDGSGTKSFFFIWVGERKLK